MPQPHEACRAARTARAGLPMATASEGSAAAGTAAYRRKTQVAGCWAVAGRRKAGGTQGPAVELVTHPGSTSENIALDGLSRLRLTRLMNQVTRACRHACMLRALMDFAVGWPRCAVWLSELEELPELAHGCSPADARVIPACAVRRRARIYTLHPPSYVLACLCVCVPEITVREQV